MALQIVPDDPRGHADRRTYTREIVPGTLADLKKRYGSIIYRPDTLVFSITRYHKNGETTPWAVDRVHLSGWRVLKGGKVSTTEGQRYSDPFDMTAGRYDDPAPQDVIDYIRLVVDSLNTTPEVE